jgi:hypothetical protein
MFADVVINSNYVVKIESGRRLLQMDNCGSHKTDAIVKLFHELGVDMALLPLNMTDLLQVLDLVVNAPIKAHIRNLTRGTYFDCFIKKPLKEKRSSANGTKEPKFRQVQWDKIFDGARY